MRLDKSRPLCPQIQEYLCRLIALGEVKPGERLMSVRDVAITVGVNPNTVQKAFEELSRDGLIFAVRGSGWYVSENNALAHRQVEARATEKVAAFFEEMTALGWTEEQIKTAVNDWHPHPTDEIQKG